MDTVFGLLRYSRQGETSHIREREKNVDQSPELLTKAFGKH